jgi:NAD(P)-dependent dehydrogenase (short-subunit alcohol dehydrogenase family)
MSNILVTGGASGLGEAITRKLASISGNSVLFTFNRSAEKAEQIQRDFPQARAIACDFRNPEDLKRLFSRMKEVDLDVLVNNALAGMTRKHFHKMESTIFLDSFEVNVLPTLQITQQAILLFRKKRYGKIITVLTSYLVNRPPTGLSEYVANKAYLESLSKSWAVESASYGITANCISPSMMRTQLTSDLDERVIEEISTRHPFGKIVTPEEVAEAVSFMVSSTQQINGINLLINGGEDVI